MGGGGVGDDNFTAEVGGHVAFDVVAVASNNVGPLVPAVEFGDDLVLFVASRIEDGDGELGDKGAKEAGDEVEAALAADGQGEAKGEHEVATSDIVAMLEKGLGHAVAVYGYGKEDALGALGQTGSG